MGRQQNKRLIIVTGPARSGLSVIAGIFHACGTWGGRTYRDRFSFDNPRIHGLVCRPLFHGLRVDPRCQESFPTIQQVMNVAPKIAPAWRRRVLDIIERQGYRGVTPWVYKGSDALMLWPVWSLAFRDAVWVIVHRNKAAIVNACLQTGYMDARTTADAWGEWYDEFMTRVRQVQECGKSEDQAQKLTVFNLWPSRILRGDTKDVRSVIESLNLSWNERAVSDFLAPARWESGIYGVKG